MKSYVLGIDLGTTTVKCVLINSVSTEIVEQHTRYTNADICNNSGEHLQRVDSIVESLQKCLLSFQINNLSNVSKVGICSQMHGVVLWNAEDYFRIDAGKFYIKPDKVSPLYTWQDDRCSVEFLSTLPKPTSHIALSSGYGCATILWLIENEPEVIQAFDTVGTIGDFVVSIICKLTIPVTSPQLAASIGYFDCEARKFNACIASNSKIKLNFPKIMDSGELVKNLSFIWCHIPTSAIVGVPLGDLQCSAYSCEIDRSQALLNISTSLQLIFMMPSGFKPIMDDSIKPVQYYPYFGNLYLAVAASLNGGNVLSKFVDFIHGWMNHFGCNLQKEKVWDTLLHKTGYVNMKLECCPILIPERHNPSLRGSLSNISSNNLTIDSIWSALNEGIVNNIYSMMPKEILDAAGILEIIGTGSVIQRNKLLLELIMQKYQLPVRLRSCTDSALGAALCIARPPVHSNE